MILARSTMHAMIARGHRGEPTTALTREAMEAWFATDRDARRQAWIVDRLGPGAGHLWRALNLSTSWVLFDETDAGWTWQRSPARELGVPAILVPVWQYDPGRWCERSVVDLIAIDARTPERVGSRGGIAALGLAVAEQARDAHEPIVWHRDALSWVRAGGDAPETALMSGSRANFFPFAPCALADELLAGGARIVVADDAHGVELEKAARRLRAKIWPASSFEVAEQLAEAAA